MKYFWVKIREFNATMYIIFLLRNIFLRIKKIILCQYLDKSAKIVSFVIDIFH